ncbi:MAG: hypothetical protein ACK2U9_04190 [Anaerolineae bacterium]
MSPAWLPLLMLAVRPAVMSITDCPSARDIDTFLAALLPDEDLQPGTASVSPSGDHLLIELRPERAAVTAQRSIAVSGDCTERAKAAAIVIATWWPGTSDGPRHVENLPGRQVESAYGVGLAAGGYVSLVSSSAAAGVQGEASFEHRKSPWGLRLAVTGTDAHEDSLVAGHVRWSRASLEIGPSYAIRWLRLDSGVVGSLLVIEGSGYDQNRRSSGGAVGATFGVRAAAPWGSVKPWLEVRGFAWPQSQTIDVTNVTTGEQQSRALPRAELHLGAGVALPLF